MTFAMKNFFRRFALLNKLYGEEKYNIILLTVLGFVNGIVGSLGIGALIPMFSFLLNKGASEDRISRYIFQAFHYVGMEPSAMKLLLVVSILFVVKAILSVIFGYIGLKIGLNYEIRTKRSLYMRTLQTNWSYISKQKIGYLENTLMNDVDDAKVMIKRISIIISQFTSFVMYLVVAFTISRFVTLMTLGVGVVILVILLPRVKRTKKYSKELGLLKKEIGHHMNETVIGIKTIKVAGVEKEVYNIISRFFERAQKNVITLYVVRNIPEDFLETTNLLFIAVVFALSYSRPGFNFAAFLITIYLIQKIFGYILATQNAAHEINKSMPNLSRVLALDDEVNRFKEDEGGNEKFLFTRSLELRNVGFSYDGVNPALHDVSFRISKGEMVGIIGPSGAGKTTLVDILLRLFVVSAGDILLDDKDMNAINLYEWRRHIGYVSQDIFLRNDTIRNNIIFYNSTLTDDDIITAAKTANCYDFIMGLPDKFDTIVGERGLRLSGGERQRVVLARVLAQKPSILILDEATSALDNESEMAIRNALKQIKGNLTIIMIAHRLSTVTDADSLFVVEHGTIIERGKPKELLEDETSYFHRAYKTGTLS
ncbi:MAG: ABC transporter ATP-binding protein [bacterium]|nr:ABC transporter ATP-binding protein [bacterium]